jgi:hypothetical protein
MAQGTLFDPEDKVLLLCGRFDYPLSLADAHQLIALVQLKVS